MGQKWADSEPSQDKTIILYDILLKKPNMVNDMQKIFQVILHILYLSKLEFISGRMLAYHAGGPGSIPGRCIVFCILDLF